MKGNDWKAIITPIHAKKDKGNRKEELKKLLLKGKQVAVYAKLEYLSTEGTEKVKTSQFENNKASFSEDPVRVTQRRPIPLQETAWSNSCHRSTHFWGSCTIVWRKFLKANAQADCLVVLHTTSSSLGCLHTVYPMCPAVREQDNALLSHQLILQGRMWRSSDQLNS